MEDVWNKAIKIGAITAVCIAGIVALCVLSLFAYMGANAFLVLLIQLSMPVAFGFILGVWLITVFWILQEDIEILWIRLKKLVEDMEE